MFLNLFDEMKNAKIPVSLREYLTFLKALTAGVAIFDVNDFYYLARTSLVKDERHIDRFDQVFSFVFKGIESVEIEVLSTNPKVAYEAVKSIIDLYNGEVKRLQDEKLIEAVNTVKEMMEQKKEERDRLEARLTILRTKYGILDYKSQVKNLSKEYYKMLAKGNYSATKVQKVKDELENLKQKGVEYENLSGRLWSARDSYNNYKLKYEEHVKELNRKKEYAVNFVNP